MTSPIVVVTAVESGFGFLLTSTILYLVLSRGRKIYHYLFAGLLLICVNWDLGVFLLMVRNQHLEELDVLGRVAILPCTFIPALIFHFANLYTGRLVKWAIALIWGLTGIMWLPIFAGAYYRIEGYYSYNWGNIFKVVTSALDLLGRPGHEALIPSEWITQLVGGNSFYANFFASVAGAFMYFATLTEVPILAGLDR